MPSSASSIAARVSAESSTPDAAAFALHLLGSSGADDRRGDLVAAQHPGERELRPSSAPRRRRSGAGAARLRAPGRPCSGPSPSPSPGSPRGSPRRGSSPGAYLPLSTPWASGDQTICEIPCSAQSGKTSASGARQIMLYCGWDETNFAAPGTSSAGADLLRRPLREPEVASLARLDDLGQRLHRLLDRNVGIEAVALVEVDVVGLQAGERSVDLLVDLLAREPRVGVRHLEEDLGREHVGVAVVAARGSRPTPPRPRRCRRRWRCRRS